MRQRAQTPRKNRMREQNVQKPICLSMLRNRPHFSAQADPSAWTSHFKNIMRECRGRHAFCWRLVNCMETPMKYCTSYWYCCPREVSSLDSHDARLNANINELWIPCGRRGPPLANPTGHDPFLVTMNILTKITRRAQTANILCANYARAMREGGFGRDRTFPKFQGCWQGGQDAYRLLITWKLQMCERTTKISSGIQLGASELVKHTDCKIGKSN